jgi:hypothetical protein
LLNDKGEPYKLSPRKKGSTDYQARAMSAKLKTYIEKTGIEGATVATFRDSWVKAMYDSGCHHKDLMLVSGIKKKPDLPFKNLSKFSNTFIAAFAWQNRNTAPCE